MGFSAGGHLAAMLGTQWNIIQDKWKYACRPNALCLVYPVITAGEWEHTESMANLKSGTKCDDLESMERLSFSIDKCDLRDFPSCFMVHNADDQDVSAMNSVLLLERLVACGKDCEMHMFHRGGHGLALGDNTTARIESDINDRYSKWMELFLSWLEEVL
jgi:acetyl esterase/lipase